MPNSPNARIKAYLYELPIGTLSIRRHRSDPAKVELWFRDQRLGSYTNALAAADDVRAQTTGYSEIDGYKGKVPSELSEWKVKFV
jgi:hypothetical protein